MKDRELLPQGEVLRDEAHAGPNAGEECRGSRGEQSYHDCTLAQMGEGVMSPAYPHKRRGSHGSVGAC